jgi:tetratricopeptide (TPR) repeat protein
MCCEPRSARTSPGRAALLVALLPFCACAREGSAAGGADANAARAPAAERASTADEPAVARPVPGDAARAAALVPQAVQALERRDLAQALELADRALALDPAHAPARLLRVRTLIEDGPTMDLDRALVDVRTLRLDAPDDPALIADEGLLRFRLGQPEAARPLLERALALPFAAGDESVHAAAAETLGWLDLQQARVDFATRRFEEAHRLAPASATPCLGLAEAAAARKDRDGEERWLREAVAHEPERLAARHALHQFLARNGRVEEAAREKELVEALRQLEDDSSLAFAQDHAQKARLWGCVADRLQDDEAAAMNCLKELCLAGDFAEAHRRIDRFAARPGARADAWKRARYELARAERATRDSRPAPTPAREERH